MAYDSVRHRSLLVAGGNGSFWMSDFWAYSNGAWTRLPDLPVAVSGVGMVFDPVRDRVVVFGGQNSGWPQSVWEYDGVGWSEHAAPGPIGRWVHGMTFASGRNKVILYGGDRSPTGYVGPLGDVWEWDGTTWTQLLPMGDPAPVPRGAMAMTFDPIRNEVQVFGGSNAEGLRNDGWRLSFAGCPQPTGACCDSSGSCQSRTVADCGTAGGTHLGVGVLCGPVSCCSGPPSITQSPQSVNAVVGTAAAFAVTVVGPGPLTYQWRRNGATLLNLGRYSGVDSPMLTVNGVTTTDGAAFDVVVSSACGVTRSDPAALLPVRRCAADFNYSGELTVQDIFEFLAAYFAGCP